MNIDLTGGKDVQLTEMLKERVEQKLSKVESRLGQKLFFRVRFNKEPVEQFSCQIHFNSARTEFNAAATEDDLIKAADQAVSKIERQLRKYQSKQDPRGSTSIRETIDREVQEQDLDL